MHSSQSRTKVNQNVPFIAMATEASYQEFLEYLVKGIVDYPEDVSVERKLDERGVLLTLKVHKDDMGKVVGRRGATAQAIRTLLRIVGIKSDAHVNLKIEEPEGSTFQHQQSVVESTPVSAPTSTPVSAAQTVDQMVEDLKI